MSSDKYVNMNIELLKQRSETGVEKYGVTLERKDLNLNNWLQHLIEEMLDGANYAQVVKAKLRLNVEAAFKEGFAMGREMNTFDQACILYTTDAEAWANSDAIEQFED